MNYYLKYFCFFLVMATIPVVESKRGLELEKYNCVGFSIPPRFGKFIKFNKIMKIQKHEFYSIKI